MEAMIDRFNLRVYGLLLHQGKVLLTDEWIKSFQVTKFPGGGLEFGEGTVDGLRREVQEEMGLEALDIRHFHTTDVFQRSAYRATDQIISIYYTFRVAAPDAILVQAAPFADNPAPGGPEAFRWLDLATACVEDVTLPIDRTVLAMLLPG